MAGVTKRKNTWFGFWTAPDGRNVMKSTKVKVKTPGLTEKQTRQQAKLVADTMENVSKGITPLDKALDALRAVAEVNGFAKPVPTIEQYLNDFPVLAAPKTEKTRRVSFRSFLEWLGNDAKLPITRITPDHMRGWLTDLLKDYRLGTVERRRQNLACVFNRAVNVDQLIVHSPLKAVCLSQLMKSLGAKDDTVARQPFTPEEMKTILYRFPQPYSDLAAASFYLAGLRLGDVCLLRWADVDFEKDGLFVKEQKTGKARLIQLLPELRERLLARRAQQPEGEEYVFPETARKYLYSSGTVSTEFTGLLKSFGISTREEDKTALRGKRRQITTKCFHSIRHTVVCWARSNPNLSPVWFAKRLAIALMTLSSASISPPTRIRSSRFSVPWPMWSPPIRPRSPMLTDLYHLRWAERDRSPPRRNTNRHRTPRICP